MSRLSPHVLNVRFGGLVLFCNSLFHIARYVGNAHYVLLVHIVPYIRCDLNHRGNVRHVRIVPLTSVPKGG